MAPSEVSTRLRQIADKIDASTKPSIARVAFEIRNVYQELAKEARVPAPAGK